MFLNYKYSLTLKLSNTNKFLVSGVGGAYKFHGKFFLRNFWVLLYLISNPETSETTLVQKDMWNEL